jgi:hypothetical protein
MKELCGCQPALDIANIQNNLLLTNYLMIIFYLKQKFPINSGKQSQFFCVKPI